MVSTRVPQLPVLRAGQAYESLDQFDVAGHRDGEPLAKVSLANAGIVRRDLKKMSEKAAVLREIPMARMLEICKAAGQHFLHSDLPLGPDENGDVVMQSPSDYVATLSKTSGLPHTLCTKNMQKVFTVFDEMPDILRGLTRGMNPEVIDDNFGEHSGVPVCYLPTTDSLGVVLPSNSPGVNSIWMPAIALKIPVVLKPGRDEPWTPWRIIQSFIAAGCPSEAFGFYPSDHEGAAAILQGCGRALLFGDESTTKIYANNPAINLHGPGRSKVLLGDDIVDDWQDYLDVLVGSVVDNGGRSCINASAIFVSRNGDAIANALAERLAAIEPSAADAEDARLSAFANPKFAEFIDASIEQGLAEGGAVDVTAQHRDGARAQVLDGAHFLRPTVVRCEQLSHPLANTEYMFPFVSVVEVPQSQMLQEIGPSLVVTGITKDAGFLDELVRSRDIDRLNLGPFPTSHVEWDQPHEGNLFEFLYVRRAIQRTDAW